MMRILERAILPSGFEANGISSGIKKKAKLDLAVFYSQVPARASCQFTTNKILAAPIIVCKKYLKVNKSYQAIIVNSGNANCFTGSVGLKDAEDMTRYVGESLGIDRKKVLVASTGIIGQRLPIDKIKKALPILIKGLSRNGVDKAKQAIMTTDTFSKEITAKFNIGKNVVTLCGIAKGAGMIAPNLTYPQRSRRATLLGFIFTDAKISQVTLDKALEVAVANSFNCIAIDGCMSTNDSIFVLANGTSGNALINTKKNFRPFVRALNLVCLKLAKMIVKDAEGATKFIRIKVRNAKSFEEAKFVALSIANSNLFKTTMYGENPNFGRIVAAVGASGIDIKQKELKLKVSPLSKRNINIDVSINRGNSSAVIYTSDLTPEYVKINAEYN